MALIFNSSEVPSSGEVIQNSTSLSVLKFGSVEVWRRVTDLNVLTSGSYVLSSNNYDSGCNSSKLYTGYSYEYGNGRYNHAACIRVATGEHSHLYLAGTMYRAWYAMSRVRVGSADPRLCDNLYNGEGEGPYHEYLEYHSGWVENQRWCTSLSFSRTISVPKNKNIYISVQGTNTTDSNDWCTATPFLNQIILKP